MNLLSPTQAYEGDAVSLFSHHGLLKREDRLMYFSQDTLKIRKERHFPYHVKKILVSPDHHFAFLLCPLFEESFSLFALPSLKTLWSYRNKEERIFPADACFSLDSKYLFLLVEKVKEEKSESQLWVLDTSTLKIKKFLEGENKHFDGIRYEKQLLSLLLYAHDGTLCFFNKGTFHKEIHISPFHEVSFIEKGEVILTDLEKGFSLFTKSGKKISDYVLLVPEKNSEKPIQEKCFQILCDPEKNLLFYLTKRNDEKCTLYLLSLVDFSLLQRIEFKDEVLSLEEEGKRLFVRMKGKVKIYFLSI